MNLNHTKEEVIVVEHYDLEKLIKSTYGTDYEIMSGEEVGSSQYAATYNIDVVKGELDEWEFEEVKDWMADGTGSYILRSIMKDMANKDVIEEGTYIIGVNW